MEDDRLSNLIANGHYRIQRCQRLLKDEADILSTDVAHICRGQFQQVPPFKLRDSAEYFRRRRRQKAERGKQSDALSRPRLSYDAKGLLKASIRDNDPVAFMEGELLYNVKGEVPDPADGDHIVPLGVADLKREGSDVSIITHGKMVHLALQAAGQLEKDGVQADVLDLRSLRPLDVDAILATVRKTNRVVYVEEGWPYAGVGAQIAALIQEEAFDHLDAPVLRVTQADVPMPYAKNLEQLAKPTAKRVVEACNKVLYR